MSGGKRLTARDRERRANTTKRVVWFCLGNGVAWVWCSYLLAYLGREEIAEDLSGKAVVEIIGVVLVYCVKSLFEKRKGFGAVGMKAEEEAEDETPRDL